MTSRMFRLVRQKRGGELGDEIADVRVDRAGLEAWVHCVLRARDDLADDVDDAFGSARLNGGEMRTALLDEALG